MASLTNKLTHVAGWSGGHWELDGARVKIEPLLFNQVDIFVEFDPNLRLVAIPARGDDHDMGHVYHWANVRLRIECTYKEQKFYQEVGSGLSFDLPFYHVQELLANGGLSRV